MVMAEAVRIHAYGGPEAMAAETIEVDAPGPGEVLVRQTAVGVNFIDVYHRRGTFPIPALPGSVGVEAAGEVIAVGAGVTRLAPGDRVAYAGPPVGAYTSHRVVREAVLVKVPDGIDDETAAAIMLKGMTAHMLLRRVGRLAPGDTVLLHAAAGGLGTILAQWAELDGARVIGVVGSDAKAAIARAAGCHEVINRREADFVEATKALTGGAGVDVVYEGVGGDVLTRSLDCLAPFGLAVNLGQVAEPLESVALAHLGPQRSLSVAVPGVFAHLRTVPDLQAACDEMFALFRDGRITARLGHVFPLARAADAHRALEAGETAGAVVLVPSP